MTQSEQLLSAFSQMYFFEEMVQDNLQFIDNNGCTQELADLILNMGDTVIAIQIKERLETARTNDTSVEMKWFESKMSKAKKQVKTTVEFIRNGNIPAFRNKRDVAIPVDHNAEIIPLAVFVNESITQYPHILEKHSEDGLTVNCMSMKDFQIMCSTLVSPAEMIDYLKYRCNFFETNGPVNILVCEPSETDLIISRPADNETLIHHFLLEKYGSGKIHINNAVFDQFRWFLQQTAERSTIGRDTEGTYTILLFLAHLHRNEIVAFWERMILARDKAKNEEYGVVGSLRDSSSYAVFFVSAPPNRAMSMEYLLEKAREKCDPVKLMQVYVWWEDDTNYRIDYMFWDNSLPQQREAEQ